MLEQVSFNHYEDFSFSYPSFQHCLSFFYNIPSLKFTREHIIMDSGVLRDILLHLNPLSKLWIFRLYFWPEF